MEKEYLLGGSYYTMRELREGYKSITGLENDKDLTDYAIYKYMLDLFLEKENAMEYNDITQEQWDTYHLVEKLCHTEDVIQGLEDRGLEYDKNDVEYVRYLYEHYLDNSEEHSICLDTAISAWEVNLC